MANRDLFKRLFDTEQGSTLFWGTLSLLFASLACYYFWQNRDNERTARIMHDQNGLLIQQTDQLKAQVERMQSNNAQAETQFNEREQQLHDREASIKSTENQIEASLTRSEAAQKALQTLAGTLPGFNKGEDVVFIDRDGFPALRVSQPLLFGTTDSTLKPEGRDLLSKLAEAVRPFLPAVEIEVQSIGDDDGAKLAAKALAANHFLVQTAKLPSEAIVAAARTEPNRGATPDAKKKARRVEFVILPAPKGPETATAPSPAPSDTAKPAP